MEEVIRRLSASTIPQTPRAPSWSPLTSPDPETESRSSENSLRSSTSATTFAPPGPPSVSRSLKRKHNQISGEAQDFSSNLENYLPLGCLLLADSVANEQQFVRKPRFWEEYHQIPEAEDWDSNLKDDLADLLAARWIRIFALSTEEASAYILRVYLLPGDVGHRFIERQGKRLALAVENLIRHIDVSSKTWSGTWNGRRRSPFEKWASCDEGSLYYMFNMIPSPAPTSAEVQAHYSREALECLLDPATQLTGLKSSLYPYQRRSAALMLQRESETRLELDPRLESRTAPDGTTYYYGARDLLFLRNPRMYESCKGGILAETMGLGKTIISVALILATKGHLPRVPVQYERPVIRGKVGSLTDMAISSVNRHSVPWRTYFDSLKAATGEEMTTCIDLMQRNPPTYEIPIEPIRFNRKTTVPPPKKITLASTTIIVVPRNLCSQWQTELRKHTDAGALSLLLMDNPRKELPPPEQLRTYDIILFSRPRFEQEIRDGSDDKGRRMSKLPLSCACPYIGASRKRDCTCLRVDDLYDSPLKHLHFLRIIIDEGHFFSSASSVAAQVAEKLVRADHRWVVSGTPAKDLLGVEMDLSGADAISGASNEKTPREGLLIQRKEFSLQDDTMGAIKSLGSLASHFLRIRPWAASYSGERPAEWDDYIYRHEDLRKRTFSGFSKCLRRFLESTVVKTRPEDVERDIELPPLVHRTILLEPSFYDKLTTNLFTLVLTANAVTSERTDADYLFHKNSAKARYQLIHNLRQSAFFWTGFSEADIVAAVKHGEGYLEKEDTRCTSQDRQLLIQCIAQAQVALSSPGWKALSKTHEIGLFVDDWPSESESLWSFAEFARPMLTGVTQLLEAQSHVNEQAHLIDATEGLAGAGIRATAPLRAEDRPISSGKKAEDPALVKSGIPVSTMTGEPNRRSTVSHNGIKKTKSQIKGKQQKLHFKVAKEKHGQPQDIQKLTNTQESTDSKNQLDNQVITPSKNVRGNEKVPQVVPQLLPSDSPLLNTRIVGTTSAKLSYLVSQITQHYKYDKILVFYDGDNVAYYIAQVLELLHIHHLIYAKSLTSAQKSEYIVRFDQDEHFRVLLMDVKQAAFGLNLSSASRVFFVNPVCRPDVEAQAIKRAHRIGQTRKVIVETLVLRGTIEEQMFERAKNMTRSEHRDARVLEDDGGIKDIIQSASTLNISESERTGYGQIAPLERPEQLWSRPGWLHWIGMKQKDDQTRQTAGKKRKRSRLNELTDDSRDDSTMDSSDEPLASKKKARTLAFIDCTAGSGRHTGLGGLLPFPHAHPRPLGTPSGSSAVRIDALMANSALTVTAPRSIFGGS